MGQIQATRLTKLSPQYYEFIGEVLFHWALFDSQMMDIIGTLLSLDVKEKRMLLGRMDEKAKMGLLKFLSVQRMKKTPLRNAIEKLCKIGGELAERRHQIAHTPWVSIPGQKTPALLKMKNAAQLYSPTAELMTSAQMLDTVSIFKTHTALGQMILTSLKFENSTPVIQK